MTSHRCLRLVGISDSSLLCIEFLAQAPLGGWQSKNWDPEVGSTRFDEFCEALAKPLFGRNATDFLSLPGGLDVPITVYNYGNYIKEVCKSLHFAISPCLY